MAAFGAIFGYISSKSIFFVGATIVALAFIFAVFRETRNIKMVKGVEFGAAPRDAFSERARAYDADTDPDVLRNRVITSIANNSSDNEHLQNNVDQIIQQVNSDQQQGGPLAELIQERLNGTITQGQFLQKIHEYVRNLAQDHDVQLREHRHVRQSWQGGIPPGLRVNLPPSTWDRSLIS